MNISMCFYSGHFIAIIVGYGCGYYFLHIISPDYIKQMTSPLISTTTNYNNEINTDHDECNHNDNIINT
jgi:hypothetical protein